MKAIVCREYGSAAVEERDRPSVADGAVLVRVRAGALNTVDWFLAMGMPRFARLMAGGVRRPRTHVVGVEFAGVVEEVGANVRQFRPGDEVFGSARGSLAEYVSVPVERVARKPARVSFEQAAGVPLAGLTALQGLRRGGLARGQRALINGASGGIGTHAVQIAKHLGGEVTGVCSTGNVELVRSLGADRVIDYTREDFATAAGHDLMLDIVGNRSWRDCGRAVKRGGTYVMAGGPWHNEWIGPLGRLLWLRLASVAGGPKMVNYVTRTNGEDLAFLAQLMEIAALTPVVGRQYGMHEVMEALQHLGTGHARGKVVVTVP